LKAFSGYNASILFIDEPFMVIDISGIQSVYKVFEEEAREALVLVTDQQKVSKGFADAKVWVVRKENKVSRLLCDDTNPKPNVIQ
jgi:ABC-type Mn2+/Zn2+ transport system ATPase subunit